MWNAQVGGLMNGTTCVIYDGNPGGSKDNPDWSTLWRFAADNQVTFFGAGAAFFANCQKSGVDLTQCGDLSRVRALGTTGSPLSPETQNWGNEQFQRIKTQNGHSPYLHRETFGGAIFQAALIFVAPSLVAIVNCRKRPVSCNAACWVAPWRLGMKRVNPCMAKWVNWCVHSLFHPCLCIFGTTKIMPATWPVILKCTPQVMAANQAVVTQTPRMGVFGGTVIGCESVLQSRAKTAVKAVSFLAAAMPPSTAMVCAWAPASFTARLKLCPM
jgi:hypothetical protein